jgi:DNA repair protein RecO (recombination protein O)
MSSSRRVHNQPAWLLHHRPFRDTSRILDVLSRDHGRLALVARGSRSAKSKLKGVLRPFMPLQISWVIRGDMGTLTGAEMNGAPVSLTGDALMSGYYMNELILSLLHRHDPQPEIFSAYESTVRNLASSAEVAATLRRYELEMLALLGYALNLDHDTQSGEPLNPEQRYEYALERGPVAVETREGPMVFSGQELLAIGRCEFSDPDTLGNAGRLLREVIGLHLGGKELQSRKVLREMRRTAERKAQV